MEKFEFEGGLYEGEAINGVPNGQGKLTYKDGTVYEGAFANGKPHGQGSFTDGAGHVFNLEWVDGRQQGGMTPQEIEELRVWAFKKVDETIDSLINEIGENSDKNDADEDK